MSARPGAPFPIGVTLAPGGANVSVVSANADAAWLCLVDDAGLEVILDVVYHHTCDGGAVGPTLS